jgi:hypothetical protein
MLPGNITTVVLFFLFVAPGITYQLIRDRYQSHFEAQTIKNPEPALRYAGRVILAGAAFTFISVSLLGIIRAWWPSLMPDPGKWLTLRNSYVASHYRLIARTVLLEVLLALALAVAFGRFFRRFLPPPSSLASAWHRLFHILAPSGSRTFARVRLKDGTEHYGYVMSYSTTLTLADRELVLRSPLRYQEDSKTIENPSSDESSVATLDPAWHAVSLSGSEIEAIWVSYISDKVVDPVHESQLSGRDEE